MSTVPIVFFGTPEFAVPSLTALRDAVYDIVAVVTQPDKPAGRGMLPTPSPIKKQAMELSIPVLQPATLKNAHILRALQSFNVEMAVCVAYGKIIPREVLNLFPKGILNIHPSLLPNYRGPSPVQSAILNGDSETGVTVMLLDEQLDHGPILAQLTVPIFQITQSDAAASNCVRDTGQTLATKLAYAGAELLIETLPKYLAGELKPQPQDHAKATFTKLLARENGHIDWSKPADNIACMVRAYDLWPGTYTMFQDMRLKILRASLLHPTIGCATNTTPGYIFIVRHSARSEESRTISVGRDPSAPRLGMTPMVAAVNCNPGSIVLEQLQLEGKKPTSGAEFMRGHPNAVGALLK